MKSCQVKSLLSTTFFLSNIFLRRLCQENNSVFKAEEAANSDCFNKHSCGKTHWAC